MMSRFQLRATAGVILLLLLTICLLPFLTEETAQYVSEKEADPMSVTDGLTPRDTPPETEASHSLARRERSISLKQLVVRGLVRRGGEAPLPGAELEALLFSGYEATGTPMRVSRIVSGTDGRFEWNLQQPETTVTLQFRSGSPDLHVWWDKKVHIIPRGTVALSEIVVFASPIDCKVSGVVTDMHGKPIDGALVKAGKTTRTDSDGRFALRTSAPYSKINLRILAAGYALVRKTLSVPDNRKLEIAIQLRKGLRIAGQVLDEAGRPVPDAKVWTPFTRTLEILHSDKDGRFEFTSLDPRRVWQQIQASKTGYTEATFSVTNKSAAKVQLILRRGHRVAGRVIGANGKALAGAAVSLAQVPARGWGLTAVARDDGRFAFPNVKSGRFNLVARGRGHAPDTRLLMVGETILHGIENIEITLSEGHSLSGLLRDKDGVPLADVRVSTRHGSDVRSNSEGRFQLNDLSPAALSLDFFRLGLLAVRGVRVEVDRDDFVLVMERTSGLAGLVVDAVTGKPLNKFRIRFFGAKLEKGELNASNYGVVWVRSGMEFSGTNGRWKTRTANMKQGSLIGVEALADGYAPARNSRVVVPAQLGAETIVLKLARGATIRGSIHDAVGGLPVSGVEVFVVTKNRSSQARDPFAVHDIPMVTTTDASGRFELLQVTAGEVRLRLKHKDWPTTFDGPFRVQDGGTTQRSIALQRSARLEGVLLGPDGKPLANTEILLLIKKVIGRKRGSWRQTTDSNGRFLFQKGLATGQYVLRNASDSTEASQVLFLHKIDLRVGETKKLRLRTPGICELSIELVGTEKLPESFTLWLSKEGKLKTTFFAGVHNARVSIQGLPAGSYGLSVSRFTENPRQRWGGQAKVTVTSAKPEHVRIRISVRKLPARGR